MSPGQARGAAADRFPGGGLEKSGAAAENSRSQAIAPIADFDSRIIMRRTLSAAGLLGGLALLGLAACASDTIDNLDHIQLASAAVNQAEDARVGDYAALELRGAHDKLDAARELRAKAQKDGSTHELQQANWLGAEAQADAEYAIAKAAALRNQAAYREMQRAVDSLQQQTQPGAGGANGDSSQGSGNNEGGGS
jgi:hypothetical protein